MHQVVYAEGGSQIENDAECGGNHAPKQPLRRTGQLDAKMTAAPYGSLKVLCAPPNLRTDGTPIAKAENGFSPHFYKNEQIVFFFCL